MMKIKLEVAQAIEGVINKATDLERAKVSLGRAEVALSEARERLNTELLKSTSKEDS